jgi:hypothetical protein
MAQAFLNRESIQIPSESGTVELTEFGQRYPEFEGNLNIGRPRLGFG